MTGEHMKREILETPAMLWREAAGWEAQAALIREAASTRRCVALIGRGSSGNACTFASYLFGLRTGRQPIEFRPWLQTQPLPEADWSDTVAYAFSVSGQSTDIAGSAAWLRARGALAIGITAAEGSDVHLADATDHLFHLNCGPEVAVPATKTFTAQLFAAAALAGFPVAAAAGETAAAMERLLAGSAVQDLATFLEGGRVLAWIARGPSLAGVRDAALKVQESLGRPAVAYSTAEVLHGPIGMFHPEDRVVLFSGSDEPMDSKRAVATTLLARGVPLLTLGTEATREAGLPLPLPEARWARTAVLAFLSQAVCLELANRAGLDPDTPAHLHKVTRTL